MNTIPNNAVTDAVSTVELNTKSNIDTSNHKNIEQAITEEAVIKETVAKEASTPVEAVVSVKQLEMVAQQLQDFVGEMNKGLEFLVDKDSGRDVIKVIDKSNGDLIKQYPSEEVLELVSKLSQATGALINEKI